MEWAQFNRQALIFCPSPLTSWSLVNLIYCRWGVFRHFPMGNTDIYIYIAIYLVVFCFYISVFTTFIRSPKFSHYDRQISRFLPHSVTHWRS